MDKKTPERLGGKSGSLSVSSIRNLNVLFEAMKNRSLTHSQAAVAVSVSIGGIRPYMRALKASGLCKVDMVPAPNHHSSRIESFSISAPPEQVQHYLANLRLFKPFDRTAKMPKKTYAPTPGRHFHYSGEDERETLGHPEVEPVFRDALVAALFGPAGASA